MSVDLFPPRGSGQSDRPEGAPAAMWASPERLGARWDWQAGKVLLGRGADGRLLGDPDREGRDGEGDDRHLVTIAGSRAGKSSTVLIPNLKRYSGSAIVLDPKGELVWTTAAARRQLGQHVIVLDPFAELGEASACHNPFAELGLGREEHVAADAALLADALIIGNDRDPHWTDAAKNLIRGLILHLMSARPDQAKLKAVLKIVNASEADLQNVFKAMFENPAYAGIVKSIGASFLARLTVSPRELSGILSTAQTQLMPLDDIVPIMDRSDFALSDLKAKPMTLYLVLPAMRMGTHHRWLRMVIQQALAAMERTRGPASALPVWFVLEEFPVLGHMRSMETAAGFMAGFGVRLWSVIQDLTQLKTHYPNSWETFLGNAGILQAFANADLTTTEYLSKRMGDAQYVHTERGQVSSAGVAAGNLGYQDSVRSAPLLAPSEITTHFARETGRQLILSPGRPPIYCQRLPRET
jgi:type IV secretion system protein VirD4